MGVLDISHLLIIYHSVWQLSDTLITVWKGGFATFIMLTKLQLAMTLAASQS